MSRDVCVDEQLVPYQGRCSFRQYVLKKAHQVVGTYSCRRRPSRWPLALFFGLLDVTAYNAFVLWTAVDHSWRREKSCQRRLFIEELGKNLVIPRWQGDTASPHTRRCRLGVGSSTQRRPKHIPTHHQEEAVCVGRRKKTSTCSMCDNLTCKELSHTCTAPAFRELSHTRIQAHCLSPCQTHIFVALAGC